MKFAFALLPIVAALGFVGATPVADQILIKRAPVPVTILICDPRSATCMARLAYGDGRLHAQWKASLFHDGQFGDMTEATMTTMTPVLVKDITCDGGTNKCTAELDLGDGKWTAQWSMSLFHQSLFSQEQAIGVMAPVPVTEVNCDAAAHRCIADLEFDDGRWVAAWSIYIFHV